MADGENMLHGTAKIRQKEPVSVTMTSWGLAGMTAKVAPTCWAAVLVRTRGQPPWSHEQEWDTWVHAHITSQACGLEDMQFVRHSATR